MVPWLRDRLSFGLSVKFFLEFIFLVLVLGDGWMDGWMEGWKDFSLLLVHCVYLSLYLSFVLDLICIYVLHLSLRDELVGWFVG